MFNIRYIAAVSLLAAVLCLLPPGPAAQADDPEAGAEVAMLMQQTLGDVAGRDLMIVEVTYPPGGASEPHRHLGAVFVYVLEGAIESQIDDGPVTTYLPGEVFYEPPRALHATSRNASGVDPARALAVMIVAPGEALVLPAD